MNRFFGRVTITGIAAFSAIGLLASQAQAHECFNTSRVAQANAAIAAHSHGWTDMQTWQLLAIFDGTACDPSSGGCAPVIPGTEPLQSLDFDLVLGVILGFAPPSSLGSPEAVAAFDALVAFNQQVVAVAATLGVPTHYLTLANADAAGGASRSAQGVTTNGKGIDHFPDAYGAQLFTAFFTVFCSDFPSDAACA
jgi:hypothetical protein